MISAIERSVSVVVPIRRADTVMSGRPVPSHPEGGLWDTSSLGATPWAIFYVQVADVKAAIARAESLGATVAVPFVDGGALEFAHLLDPDGQPLRCLATQAAGLASRVPTSCGCEAVATCRGG